MKFGSVCSGIEAASVAWGPLGWKAAWLSEIDPFASAVLAHHYPDVPNLGDMTKLPWRIASGEVEASDVFCGGTPCQAFSVAGLRRSLDDARGNLSLTFCEIANEIDKRRMDAGLVPCIVFWENVPGVLSTSDNAFGCFLAGLAGEDDPLFAPGGKWTNSGYVLGPKRAVAWRVLDAQYFGVAQRRRRVFVIASAREGFDPAAVLFEFEGVRRDSAPSREAWEGATGGAGTSAANCSGQGWWSDANGCAATIRAQDSITKADTVITMAHGQGGAEIGFDRGPTLTCNHEAPIAAYSAKCVTGDVTHTLKAEGFDASEDGTGRGQPIVPAYGFNARQDPDHWSERTGPLDTDGGSQAIAFAENSRAEVRPEGGDGAVTGALKVGGGKPGQSYPVAQVGMHVRRLTPRECERLQGFPDDYTLIPWKAHQAWARRKDTSASGESFEDFLIRTTGRGLRQPTTQECPDGPRYKALGNSWAVPNVRWIGIRIDRAVKLLEHANDNELQSDEVAA